MYKHLISILLAMVLLGCGRSGSGSSQVFFPPETEIIATTTDTLVANIASTSPTNIGSGYTYTLLTNAQDINDAMQLGMNELRKYPKRILTGLDKVYFLQGIKSGNDDVGGVHFSSIKGVVYVVYYNFDNAYTRGTVHHELMHLLNFQYKSMPAEWPEPTAADQSIPSSDWEALAKAGYTRIYGTSSKYEDIATFAEGLFTGFGGFWYKYNSQLYPKFNQKANIAIEYLRSIDSRFTLEYFKSASNGGNFNGQ